MTIAVIGTGNMGGAIVRGLIKSGTCAPKDIICTAKTENTLNKLRGYCVMECKRINGAVTFDDAVRFQNSSD